MGQVLIFSSYTLDPSIWVIHKRKYTAFDVSQKKRPILWLKKKKKTADFSSFLFFDVLKTKGMYPQKDEGEVK